MKKFLIAGFMVMALATQAESKSEKSNTNNGNLKKNPLICKNCQSWQVCQSGKCVCAPNLCATRNPNFSCIEGQCQCDNGKCPSGQFCSQRRQKGKSGNYFEQACVECQNQSDCEQDFEICFKNKCTCSDRKCNQINQGDVCNQDGTACVDCTAEKGCKEFQQCNTMYNQCICDDDKCALDQQVCSTLDGQGECVQCRDDNTGKCQAGKPYCLQNVCVECLADADCPNPDEQSCNSGVCQCSQTKCNGNGKTCESAQGQCSCTDEYCLTIGTDVCNVLGSTGSCSVACRDETHCTSQIQSCDTTGTPICVCDSSKCGILAKCDTQDENGSCVGFECVDGIADSDGDGVNDCRPGQICNTGFCECDTVGNACTDLSGTCLSNGECKVTDCSDVNNYANPECATGEVCLTNSDGGVSCASTQIRCRSVDGFLINEACPTGMSCLPASDDPAIENSPYCVPLCTAQNLACSNFDCGFDYVLSQGTCVLSNDNSALICKCSKSL